jgi:hypothetical protein
LDILKCPTRSYADLYSVLANGLVRHMLLSVYLLGINSNVHTKLENLRLSSDKSGIWICLLHINVMNCFYLFVWFLIFLFRFE